LPFPYSQGRLSGTTQPHAIGQAPVYVQRAAQISEAEQDRSRRSRTRQMGHLQRRRRPAGVTYDGPPWVLSIYCSPVVFWVAMVSACRYARRNLASCSSRTSFLLAYVRTSALTVSLRTMSASLLAINGGSWALLSLLNVCFTVAIVDCFDLRVTISNVVCAWNVPDPFAQGSVVVIDARKAMPIKCRQRCLI